MKTGDDAHESYENDRLRQMIAALERDLKVARSLECIVCGKAITDLAKGWVRPWRDGPIYGLCSEDARRILDGEVTLRWTPAGWPVIDAPGESE